MSETLTVEAAVEALQPNQAAEVEAPQEETPEVVEAEGEEPQEPDDDGEPEQPEPEPVAAPKSWPDEQKEFFATLPREAQEAIAAREADRDRTVQKALTEKAQAIKQASEQAAQAAAEFRQKAEQVMPEALRRVAELEAFDLVDLNRRDPAMAQQVMIEKEKAKSDLAKLQADVQSAQKAEYQAHLARLAEELPTRVPDLVDPEKGAERANEVGRYLISKGIPEENIKWVSAAELEIAYDAMRWRRSQEAARSVTAKPAPAPSKPVRPASAAPRTQTQTAVETARKRLGQTGSVDDAVALLQLRRKS